MRQLIIARKDLQMSPGKLAAQVAHASIAFITRQMKENGMPHTRAMEAPFETPIDQIENPKEILFYECSVCVDKATYEEWLNGIFTKTVCEAKNYNQLIKVEKIADELGLKKDIDYFEIWDACLTELQPEKVDEQGCGRTLTCIGFKPLPDDVAWKISKKYQLYT